MRTSLASSSAASPRLEVRDLAAGYGGEPVVSDISLALHNGEILAVIGPNGSGKSTLLKAIVGEVRVMGGHILLDGRETTRLGAERLARLGVGYVPQLNDVFDGLSVLENLEMGGYLLSRSAVSQRVEEVVETLPALGAMLQRDAKKLSGGERKMLAVGRALMNRPGVLLLDEPTANLSPKLAATLLGEYVRRLAESGVAILLVEQRASLALEAADWAYVLVAGRVRLSGDANEILDREDWGEVFLGRAAGGTPQ
jgi:ABC-type branched-subunit amino acid transport system ATPase component